MKGIVIGVDVGGTNIRCAAVSRDKGIIKIQKEKIANKNSKAKINEQLANIIGKIKTSINKKIIGIGAGVPSIIDLKNGIINETFNLPAWHNVPLKKILESKFNAPVRINNDAKCFALGEKCFGCAKKYGNIAGIILGTGFGVGIIIDNKIYAGSNCAAGEFGRLLLKDKTIEDYCAGKFFKNKYWIKGEKLAEMAKNGNKKALRIFKEYGKNLGLGVATVVNAIDPEIVVLGGSVSKSYNFFRKPFLDSLKTHVYKSVYRNIVIKPSRLDEAGVLGAASLFFNQAHE